MATVPLQLRDDEAEQLRALALGRETTAELLAARWVRERLVHECERAAGGGKPMSPRARRSTDLPS